MKSTATKSKSCSKTATGVDRTKAAMIGAEDRHDYVATAAYYKAEARGFSPGRELEDWLDAEAQFNSCEER